jgi:hypothetical protein
MVIGAWRMEEIVGRSALTRLYPDVEWIVERCNQVIRALSETGPDIWEYGIG